MGFQCLQTNSYAIQAPMCILWTKETKQTREVHIYHLYCSTFNIRPSFECSALCIISQIITVIMEESALMDCLSAFCTLVAIFGLVPVPLWSYIDVYRNSLIFFLASLDCFFLFSKNLTESYFPKHIWRASMICLLLLFPIA